MRIGMLGVPELVILLIIGCAVGCAFGYACMRIASKKGYNELGFFLLGFFLDLIGLIIALCLSPRKDVESITEADALLKYKQLLDDGVITQAEFDAKKQELL